MEGPCRLWIDNTATIAAIQNEEQNLTEFTKHIAIAFMNSRHEFRLGKILPMHRESAVLFTDCLTKPLASAEHKQKCSVSPGFRLIVD